MIIADLYEKYNLMPQLREHQLRVGGIVKLITEEWSDRSVAIESTIAALTHDMGNMAKVTLNNPIMPIDNIAYWEGEQNKFWAKYGKNANNATFHILREEKLGRFVEILEEESKAYEQGKNFDFATMRKSALMVLYADLRVGPFGVITVQERIDDLKSRYKNEHAELKWAAELEVYVQTLTRINITMITEASVTPLFDELLTYTI